MSQTAYNQYQAAGYAGLLYDSGFGDNMSYSAEGNIPFGFPVILGTDEETQVAPMGTGAGQAALVIGISVASHDVEQQSDGSVVYPDEHTVPVRKKGRIWVKTSDAVVAGAVANVTLADGTFTDAAVTTGIEAFTQFTARFITSTSGAGLAVVEIK